MQDQLFTAHTQMTGLSDLHLDFQACRILTVIKESCHIKHLAKDKWISYSIAEGQK